MGKKITYNDFIIKCKEKYKDDIDLSYINKEGFDYTNRKELFYCNKHNQFISLTPKMLLWKRSDKVICKQCSREYHKQQCTGKSHIKTSKIIYNKQNLLNKIDNVYNSHTIVKLTDNIIYKKDDIIECFCKEHGNFNITIKQLLKRKYLCPICKQVNINNKNIQNGMKNRKDNFISEAIKQHGAYYDYSKVKFDGKLSKVEIICHIHGPFWMMPSLHLRGEGCSQCNKIKLNAERRLGTIINEFITRINRIYNIYNLNLQVIPQYHGILKRQSLDYFITDNNKINIGIEYQGDQHFNSDYYNKYFKDDRHSFEHLMELDINKYNICKENNIKMFYFTFNKTYDDLPYIEDNNLIYTDINKLKSDIEQYIINNK